MTLLQSLKLFDKEFHSFTPHTDRHIAFMLVLALTITNVLLRRALYIYIRVVDYRGL